MSARIIIKRDELIEEATKAIRLAYAKEMYTGMGFEGAAEAALAVFEKAHTPTDDEREAHDGPCAPKGWQGEPSDAQVIAAVNAYRDHRNMWGYMNSTVHYESMRAALRAAGDRSRMRGDPMTEPLLTLPQTPGTVIAIGEWWLVRLRPYETGAKSWELLPFRSTAEREHAERLGVKAQCVYGDDWVLAEAEQEGGYLVISDPREIPSGIQYFRQELAKAAEPDGPGRDDPAPDGGDLVRRASEAYREGGATLLQIRLGEAGLPPESIAMITHLIKGTE